MTRKLDRADTDLKKKIALRIKELREDTGKNQTQFAYNYGKDKQTQHRLEKGRGATIYTISKFCKATGITLSQFFDSHIFAESKK